MCDDFVTSAAMISLSFCSTISSCTIKLQLSVGGFRARARREEETKEMK
jgi:hypothetical protein